MFEHEIFEVYTLDKIPLDTDIYLRDEVYLPEYESICLKVHAGEKWEPVGLVSFVAARRINHSSITLSWYPNISDRFHEVSILLPSDQVVICVGSHRYDEKPTIFVKSEWLKNLHLKLYSVFGLIDADGIKAAINDCTLSVSKLQLLRNKIDELACRYPGISFISFADSLLLKSNWTVGHFQLDVKYTYEPEVFIRLFAEVQSIYQEVLSLKTYGVFTQGSNEYYNDPLLHISETKNHVCLNSLGTPFAELQAIEKRAREAIRTSIHGPCEIYMDSQYFHSLKLNYEFKQKNGCGRNEYQRIMNKERGVYFYSSCADLLANLD